MIHQLEPLAQLWLNWVVPLTWQLALLIAIVAVAVWVGQRASPRFRYALWLLVLIKIFLPPTLAIGWSVGDWGVRPLWNSVEPVARQLWETKREMPEEAQQAVESSADKELTAGNTTERRAAQGDSPPHRWSLTLTLFAIWSIGYLGLLTAVLWRYRRLVLAVEQMERVEEGSLSVQYEKIALQMKIKHVPEVYLSDEAASPFLFGVFRPRMVLPKQVAAKLNSSDLDSILLHELSHWRRRDPWIGWLQVLGQSLFWFHPLVWWANARLRHERECVCDEAVLRIGACEPAEYGEALLGVLSAARGRSRVQGSLVGVFEPGGNIQHRLEEIMNYETKKSEFGFLPRVAILAMALFFLPMAIPAIGADRDLSAPKETVAQPRYLPWVAKTSPPAAATEVDPKLGEISITFDRDMSDGASPTGDPRSFFPPIPGRARGHWRDRRTWVLPVKLSAGQYYRVGINSKRFRNFKSSTGESAPCSVLCFVTKGATPAVKNRVQIPKIVKMTPANGAEDVDPSVKSLRVAFSLPMGKGMSWTGGGENFPDVPPGQRPKWASGSKTCVLPVRLKSGSHYLLGINSPSHINFQSKWGVPVEATEYRFATQQ